jgi:anti-sigma factor RsiW
MNPFAAKKSADTLQPACRATQGLLSEYIDSTLSARQTWEVEKHLAVCKECGQASRQMQETVSLLRGAARFDTGDDFMARLHARLDDVAPEPARRRSVAERTREALDRARAGFSVRRIPGLNLGVAAAGVAALLFIVQSTITPHVTNPNSVGTVAVSTAALKAVHENLQRNVALTATDPLGDVAAENLADTDGGTATNTSGAAGSNNATNTGDGG